MGFPLPYKLLRRIGKYLTVLLVVELLFLVNMRILQNFKNTDIKEDGIGSLLLKNDIQRKTVNILDHEGNQSNEAAVNRKPEEIINGKAEGEELALRIQQKCKAYLKKQPPKAVAFPITTNKQHKLLFCPMCKLASTYWTRFFRLLLSKNENALTPYDIPMKEAPPTRERISFKTGKTIVQYEDYYKFMYVRDPFARIISAYIDKLFAPNPTFWKDIAYDKIIRKRPRSKKGERSPCGSDLTFEEYVQAIVTNHQAAEERGKVDCHDESFMGACHPCEIKFDFIGKMEYFSRDSNHLHNKLGMNKTIEALAKNGKRLADEDALQDTVNSPFAWKESIKRCISWREALMRIWRKLQIRGVIGKQPLPLNDEQAEKITKPEFIKLILDTQTLTSYDDRKKQRKEALIEIFSGVKPEILNKLKVAFRNDFDFFEYDDNPAYIFDVDRSKIQYYGYLDLH